MGNNNGPDKRPEGPGFEYSWFALAGVIIYLIVIFVLNRSCGLMH